jgi:hypothetical protein
MQKYSSNVVEKCIEKSEEFALNKFIEEVSYMNRVAGMDIRLTLDLMKNNYGNYVVQKALKLAHSPLKEQLIGSIIKNIEKIGDRKLIFKWQNIVTSHLNYNPFEETVNINCHNKRVFKTVVNNKPEGGRPIQRKENKSNTISSFKY